MERCDRRVDGTDVLCVCRGVSLWNVDVGMVDLGGSDSRRFGSFCTIYSIGRTDSS